MGKVELGFGQMVSLGTPFYSDSERPMPIASIWYRVSLRYYHTTKEISAMTATLPSPSIKDLLEQAENLEISSIPLIERFKQLVGD